MPSASRFPRLISLAALFTSGLLLCAADEPPKVKPPAAAATKSMWQRMLKGEDERQAKALKLKTDELVSRDKMGEARAAAKALLALRTRAQGEDHWQTINARWQLKTLARFAELTHGQRLELVATYRDDAEATTFLENAEFAKAQNLLKKILAARR